MSLRTFCAGTMRAAVIGLMVAGGYAAGALAQTAPSGTDVQSILNAISGQSSPTTTSPAQQMPSTPAAPSQTTLQPATPPVQPATPQPPSHLEQLFSQRAGRTLTQFGYDTFGVGSSVPVTQVGALQDTYVLGVNDTLNIVLRGHQNIAYTVTIDREGRIILPDLPPIAAAGRTLGDVRAEISQREAKSQIGAQAFVSVGTVRQVSVLVKAKWPRQVSVH